MSGVVEVTLEQIHWYPGHMARTRKMIQEARSLVDVVLELVDARLPKASANPMLDTLLAGKPRLLVMTRADMADPKVSRAWVEYYVRHGRAALPLDARTGHGTEKLLPRVRALAPKRSAPVGTQLRPRAVRMMIVGIPNVGKSSLINRLSHRAGTKIGDRPGITKTLQWIHVADAQLLDTPGILWPKLEDQQAARMLAISGAIKPELLDEEELCKTFIPWVHQHYPGLLAERYGVDEEILSVVADELGPPLLELLERIGLRRGLVRTGGAPDTLRAAELVIREVQTGKLGRLSLEWPTESGD
ncbi:ribosome biogenesis GTPase YlqF [Alicyclobacillaceae bacterium I2511]|nr:ribosome biogenesis GTPase YlqF [Alicyclobacillaceae bacterium I2511]